MKKAGIAVLILLAVGGLLWLLFSDKGKSITGFGRWAQPITPTLNRPPTTHTPVNPLQKPTTKIVKNDSGNGLLLVTTNPDGSIYTKALTFDDAIKAVGSSVKVCAIAKYDECSRIRM